MGLAAGEPARRLLVGILRRYVIFEIARAFLLALLTMSAIFVLFLVAAKARDIGLSPGDVIRLIPYIIPNTLPYTVPVSLLFASTVVYGRLAGDNEIIAVKTAGLSVMTMLWPTFLLAAALCAVLLYISVGWIPEFNRQAKLVIFKDLEDTVYKLLKRDREFDHRRWPFLIKVRDVEDRVMIEPTFKHKVKGRMGENDYDAVIQARRAVMHFDLPGKKVLVTLVDAELQGRGSDVVMIDKDTLEIPIPPDSQFGTEKTMEEFTNDDIAVELAKVKRLLATERRRQAIQASFGFGSGRLDQINWSDVNQAFVSRSALIMRSNDLETERQRRFSMGFGTLLFVVLGAPVGILFARRDFLSAFISCFLPIILIYYPLMLFGVNASKEGVMNPTLALWMGNILLAVLAGFVLPPVIKH